MGQRQWERAGLVVIVKAFHEELEATSFLVDLRGSQLSCPAANSMSRVPSSRWIVQKNRRIGTLVEFYIGRKHLHRRS